MTTVQYSEQLIAYPAGLSSSCTDAELLTWMQEHYFSSQELDEARHILIEQGYEEAIAYLARVGQDSLRCGEPPPRLYITIPGGKLIIYRPGTPAGAFAKAFTFGIGEFARLVLPQPPAGLQTSTSRTASPGANGMLTLWAEFDAAELPPPKVAQPAVTASPTKPGRSRPRKLHFDEQAIRVGQLGHTVNGWVVRERGLAYLIESVRGGKSYEVRIVHLKSTRVIASWYIPQCDELAHTRMQRLMEEIVLLTDWNQGMRTILQQKQGRHKPLQWARQILDIWSRHERESLFSLRNEFALQSDPDSL